MARSLKSASAKAGMKPGEVVFVGKKRSDTVSIRIVDYDRENYRELVDVGPEDCLAYRDSESITWIDICGLHDIDSITRIGEHFKLHPLVLEDIVNTTHRPKLEEADEYIFSIVKMLYETPGDGRFLSEQVSLVFTGNTVITFQEQEGDVFDAVRTRLKKTVPRVRFMGSDYLAYALLDAIVDNYYAVLERIGDRVEVLEDELIDQPSPTHLEAIHELKRELIFIRKAVWPLREVVAALDRSESSLIHDYTGVYIRDLYEHVVQVIDGIETFRDMVTGLLDIYLSSISNRMNEVMKVLTIIATIFIPLGFLAGVYGMNFDTATSPFNMPELGFRYGYLVFWGAVLVIGGGLVWFFRRKRWL